MVGPTRRGLSTALIRLHPRSPCRSLDLRDLTPHALTNSFRHVMLSVYTKGRESYARCRPPSPLYSHACVTLFRADGGRQFRDWQAL